MLCNRKKIKIIEAEVCPDHVMLAEIPPKTGGIKYHGIPKGEKQSNDLGKVSETEIQIWERLLVAGIVINNIRPYRQYSNREFWRRRYYVDKAGKIAQKKYRSTTNVSWMRIRRENR